MADFDLKSISPAVSVGADTEMLFGAVDQSTGTPKPYLFSAVKSRVLSGVSHPGYKANVYYVGSIYAGGVTPGGAPSLTTAYFSLIQIGGNSSITLSSLAARITTGGSSNIQLAIYADDTTVSPHRPGAFIAATGNIVNTATGSVAGTFTGVSVNPGFYWIGIQTNDTTMRWQAISATGFAEAYYIGSATLTGFLSPSVITGVSTSSGISAFGTWPANLNGSTWNESTSLGPSVAFLASSVP